MNTTPSNQASALDSSVGELVAQRPGRARVFEHFEIDYCCHGAQSLREACKEKGIESEKVLAQLEAEQQEKKTDLNPADLRLDALARYIVDTHHGFLQRELPRLHQLAAKVADVHGANHPYLVELRGVFEGLEAELVSHLAKEENILFPMITAMGSGQPAPNWIEGPINQMMHEHESAGAALARMRVLTDGYSLPEDACNSYRALFAGLREMEEDLHRHIHLENTVLFPGTKAMAGR